MENVHEGLKRFKCEKCSQKFTERKALTLHIKGIHEKIKEFNCDRCGKFFFLKDAIWKYMHKQFMKKKENLFAKFAKKDLVYQEP